MKAIVLFSGGLDSTTMLGLALEKKRECLALTFDYGQRHRVELDAAAKIAAHWGITLRLIRLEAATFGQSSLVGVGDVPKEEASTTSNTYVPARNTLFLAYALGQAEMESAQEIYFGPNLADLAGYPDCRPAFIDAFQNLAQCATRQATGGAAPEIIAPLIHMDKKAIVEEAIRLKVPLHLTHSCYDPIEDKHCGQCAACRLRKEAFTAAGVPDPTLYL